MVITILPIDNVLFMHVLETTADFSSIEDCPFHRQARLSTFRIAHVVNMVLQIASIHQRQDHAQCLLRFTCIRQRDLKQRDIGHRAEKW